MVNTNLSPATLTFYLLGQEKKDTKEVLDKVAEESNLNIKLDFKWFSNEEYVDKVKTAIASNEKVDVFLCGRPDASSSSFVEMFRNGSIKDLTQLLPKYAPAIYKQLNANHELDVTRVNGKIAVIPSLCPEAKCLVSTVKQEYVDNLNISPVKTIEDYGNAMKKIKENDKTVTPGSIGGYNLQMFAGAYGYAILDYSLGFVYKADDPEMKVIPWEQTPEFKGTVSTVNKWYKEGLIDPTKNKIGEVGSLLYSTGSCVLGTIALDVNQDGNKVMYNNYLLYGDKKIQRDSPIGNVFENGVIAFNSKSTNTERALMLLNWIQSSQKNYDLFMYGIKDKDYVMQGERYKLPDGIRAEESPYMGWACNAFLNINFQRLPVADSIPDNYLKEHIDFINSKTAYAPHEGFYPDYTNIQNEFNSRMQIYQNKITNALSTNTFDLNKTDSVIQELANSGAQRIVQEVQKQLDKWRPDKKG